MKLLIVHASAGAGHRKAAEAVYNYIRAHHPEEQVVLCDILDYATAAFRFCYRDGYAFLINRLSWLWGVVFFLTTLPVAGKLIRLFSRWAAIAGTERFSRYVCAEQFDAVLSTHFLPPELIGRLRRRKRISSRIFCAITDYGVHPFWITAGVDEYIVATGRTKELLVNRGIDALSVKVLGIPVDQRYSCPADRRHTAQSLGLDPQRFTVLAVTGSFGIGPLEKIARTLSGQDLQILVVCARNAALKELLDKKQYPGVRAFGFIDTMPALMSVSDLIITKPGGSTITELLASGLVPLFISAIPGQEVENISILASYQVGELVGSAARIKERVLDLKDHPAKLEAARSHIKEIKKPFSARDIYETVRAGCSGAGG